MDEDKPPSAQIGQPSAWPPAFRRRILVELLCIVVGSELFLALKPKDSPYYVGSVSVIGLLALSLLGRFDLERIWGRAAGSWRERFRSGASAVAGPTLLVMGIFVILGLYLAWRMGPFGTQVAVRFGSWSILPALPLYFASAYLQEAFFQWYLVGRLRVGFPKASQRVLAIVNGVFFGLVHIPMGDPILVLLTAAGGAVWTEAYLRGRSLVPVALSHTLLGATYFYWVRGEDKLLEVLRELGRGELTSRRKVGAILRWGWVAGGTGQGLWQGLASEGAMDSAALSPEPMVMDTLSVLSRAPMLDRPACDPRLTACP